MNLVAMYHYVRPHNSDGVTGITPEELSGQLAAIRERGFTFVSVDEYVARKDAEDGLALVTFDDAVRDQYEHAFPVLTEHDVPAVVFAPMRPYSGEPDGWTTQHLLHALAEHLGWDELERRVDALTGAVEVDEAAMHRTYHYEMPERRRLKFLLGFVLDPATVRSVLGEVNAEAGLRPDDWFMRAEELREMQDAGHTIGGHGFDHVAYGTLSAAEQAADMERAVQEIERVCGPGTRPLAYPFGSHTAETAEIARRVGYSYGFTTAERVDANVLMRHLESL